MRALAAEALGTFFLVLAGCAAAIAYGGGAPVALTFALVVAALVYALGHVSGAHFNPAITLGFAIARRFPARRVPAYVAAQLAGALGAALLLRATLGDVRGATTAVAPGVALPAALALEVAFTFLLAFVIAAVATDPRVPRAASGVAIGAAVAVGALAAGPFTGGSMNPARTLGPAVAAGAFADAWLYVVAPLAGGILGFLAYERLRARVAPESSNPSGSMAEPVAAPEESA